MSTAFNNWKLQLEDWAGSEEGQDGDKALEDYNAATEGRADVETKVRLTLGEPEALILGVLEEEGVNEDGDVLVGASTYKVRLFHSPTIIGGTRARKEKKLIVLEGLDHSAKGFVLDKDSSFRSLSIKTPKIKEIVECSTKEMVAALEPVTSATGALKCSAVFLLPPWAMASVLKADTVDPSELLCVLAADAKVFDTAHEGDPNYPSKASDSVKPLLRWLYSVYAGEVPATVATPADEDSDVAAHRNSRQAKFILPPFHDATGPGVPPTPHTTSTDPSVLMSVMKQNNEVLSKMADAMETGNRLTATQVNLLKEKQKAKLDRGSKFHDSVIKMIRFAAAPSEADVEDEIPESASLFFNCETVGKATQELTNQLKALGVIRPSFATGTIESLRNGDLLWENSTTPRNLSVFMFWKGAAGSPSAGSCALLLHFLDQSKKEKSEAEIKKALKQAVRVPQTYQDMMDQMLCFHGQLKVMFGKTGHLPAKYGELIFDLRQLQEVIEEGQQAHPKFCASIMYRADVRVHEFLKSCMETTNRDDVRSRCLYWKPLLDSIEMQEHVPSLPSSFEVQEPNDAPPDNAAKRKAEEDLASPTGAKKRRVRNVKPCKEFALTEGEDYKWFSAEKESRPKFRSGNCKLCPKFHIKKVCYTTCIDAETHLPEDKLKDKEKAAYKEWMNSVRAKHA
jgi:hypothetical protein